jgi:8-oxo-dGTP pyrophosphatase MutT (NUDIX family)
MSESQGAPARSRPPRGAPERDTRGRVVEFVEAGVRDLLPHLSVDCTIFGFHAGELKILLLKWKGVDWWCLPGGYVRRDETLDDAACRVLGERTGLRQIFLQQFRAFGATGRG